MKRQHETPAPCIELPIEIWQEIFRYLSIRSLFLFNKVCRAFNMTLLYKSVRILNAAEIPFPGRIDYRRFSNVEYIDNECGSMKLQTIALYYDRLRSLVLSLRNESPLNSLSRLTNLATITFKSASSIFYDNIQKDLSCLTNLTELYIPKCNAINVETLKPLQKLVSLSITGTKKDNTTQQILSSLTCLKRLELRSEYSHGHIEWQFPVSLEFLSLVGVRVADSLATLTNLTELRCHDSDFNTRPMLLLSNLTSLSITGAFYAPAINDLTITRLVHLKSLDLGLQLNLSDKGMASLVNLHTLRLSHKNHLNCQLRTSSFFSRLTNLTTLSLNHEF